MKKSLLLGLLLVPSFTSPAQPFIPRHSYPLVGITISSAGLAWMGRSLCTIYQKGIQNKRTAQPQSLRTRFMHFYNHASRKDITNLICGTLMTCVGIRFMCVPFSSIQTPPTSPQAPQAPHGANIPQAPAGQGYVPVPFPNDLLTKASTQPKKRANSEAVAPANNVAAQPAETAVPSVQPEPIPSLVVEPSSFIIAPVADHNSSDALASSSSAAQSSEAVAPANDIAVQPAETAISSVQPDAICSLVVVESNSLVVPEMPTIADTADQNSSTAYEPSSSSNDVAQSTEAVASSSSMTLSGFTNAPIDSASSLSHATQSMAQSSEKQAHNLAALASKAPATDHDAPVCSLVIPQEHVLPAIPAAPAIPTSSSSNGDQNMGAYDSAAPAHDQAASSKPNAPEAPVADNSLTAGVTEQRTAQGLDQNSVSSESNPLNYSSFSDGPAPLVIPENDNAPRVVPVAPEQKPEINLITNNNPRADQMVKVVKTKQKTLEKKQPDRFIPGMGFGSSNESVNNSPAQITNDGKKPASSDHFSPLPFGTTIRPVPTNDPIAPAHNNANTTSTSLLGQMWDAAGSVAHAVGSFIGDNSDAGADNDNVDIG